jgi:hypothetical protein
MKKKYNPLPKKHERTVSFSSPKDSRRGCLCKNRNEYSVKCCDGLLIEQGIGNINAPVPSCLRWTINREAINKNTTYTVTYVDCIGAIKTITSKWWVPQSPDPFFSGPIIRLIGREIIDDGGLPFEVLDADNFSCDTYRLTLTTFIGTQPYFVRYRYINCNNQLTYVDNQQVPFASFASFQSNAVIYAEVLNQPDDFQLITNTNTQQ